LRRGRRGIAEVGDVLFLSVAVLLGGEKRMDVGISLYAITKEGIMNDGDRVFVNSLC
jgi:hypothetical protein